MYSVLRSSTNTNTNKYTISYAKSIPRYANTKLTISAVAHRARGARARQLYKARTTRGHRVRRSTRCTRRGAVQAVSAHATRRPASIMLRRSSRLVRAECTRGAARRAIVESVASILENSCPLSQERRSRATRHEGRGGGQ